MPTLNAITVTTYRSGVWQATGYADGEEAALVAARAQFADAWDGCAVQGATRAIDTIFTLTDNDAHLLTVTGRRP